MISPTNASPWNMICQLMIEFPDDTVPATGWIAGPRCVVTAGHCLLFHNLGGAANSIVVTPARNATACPYGKFKASSWAPHDQWRDQSNPDWDLGYIRLEKPVNIGAFKFSHFEDSYLKNHYVNIAGYPRHVEKYPSANGDHLFHNANRIRKIGAERLYYDVDATGGQSGAPVWIHKTTGADPIVIGVHAGSAVPGKPGWGGRYNSSPRLTKAKCDVIADWCAASAVGA
ncbi:MAG: trypsin-like serine protease [Parvularculaceae bacterium]|nr:trypsin-like serine protease [Parvularculaceae bacterium]